MMAPTMNPGISIRLSELACTLSMDKSVREGTVTYDIRFRAIVPDSEEQIALIINVEDQNDFYPGYPLIKRGIYYCCRMISSQYGLSLIHI